MSRPVFTRQEENYIASARDPRPWDQLAHEAVFVVPVLVFLGWDIADPQPAFPMLSIAILVYYWSMYFRGSLTAAAQWRSIIDKYEAALAPVVDGTGDATRGPDTA